MSLKILSTTMQERTIRLTMILVSVFALTCPMRVQVGRDGHTSTREPAWGTTPWAWKWGSRMTRWRRRRSDWREQGRWSEAARVANTMIEAIAPLAGSD